MSENHNLSIDDTASKGFANSDFWIENWELRICHWLLEDGCAALRGLTALPGRDKAFFTGEFLADKQGGVRKNGGNEYPAGEPGV